MVARSFGRFTAKVMGGAKSTAAGKRAADYGARLRAEYEAGKRGDTPDASAAGASDASGEQAAADAADAVTADEVATAMRKVDWARVKTATAGTTAAATTKVRSMASEVDWDKVQPVAAQVSSALIAAVASGQIPLGGRLGTQVARTIMNDHDLARQVATVLARTPEQQRPPDFRPLIAEVIDTTAVEPPSSSGDPGGAQPNT